MRRVRISTTVDASSWNHARRLLDLPSSRLVDRALQALIDQLEDRREQEVLEAFPYEDDPDLQWDSPDLPDLPYEGDVPPEVLKLAQDRRRAKGK